MAWDDAPPFEKDLKAVLDRFDWSGAAEICDSLVRRIQEEPEVLPVDRAKKCLSLLRRKRLFRLVTQLAEALLASGQRTPLIRRQYAQALIDRGILVAPELVLQSILQDSQLDQGEEKEARGLLGRIYKQLYVNACERLSADAEAQPRPDTTREESRRLRDLMQRALSEYLAGYRLDPWNNYWHGINAVALLARAERDDFSTAGVPDYRALASDILRTLEGHAEEAPAAAAADGMVRRRGLDAWELATMMETLVALEEYAAAREYALEYAAHPDADAFEVASTLRQLEEVWQLTESEEPGSLLLPICRAALLQREGGAFRISPETAAQDLSHIAEAGGDAREAEATPSPSDALDQYREALSACRAVARIENLDGEGRGTGLLVHPEDFFPPGDPREAGGLLLLTNAHVVSPVPFPTALLPSEAVIVFQLAGQRYEVGEVVWHSPPDKLDASLLRLKGGAPAVRSLRLAERWSSAADVPERVLLIGHPGASDSRFSLKAGGDDARFSFQDALPIESNRDVLRYTTPTPAGSSGSAVFNTRDWSVVALQHSGRGGGDATHVNEAAPLPAIREAARAALSGMSAGTEAEPAVESEGPSGLEHHDKHGGGHKSAKPPSPKPPAAAARFYFALEGDGARGRSVRRGADVDLIFNYDVPPIKNVIALVEKAEGLQQARRSMTPLGMTVAPVGFAFRKEGDSGYRVMNFHDGGARGDKLRFELRADETEPAAGAGFHVIFDVHGSILYQLFLPVRLVSDLPKPGSEGAGLPPLSLDLDGINSFAEQAAADARMMDAAVREVLSHA
jgi:hypothetical protein